LHKLVRLAHLQPEHRVGRVAALVELVVAKLAREEIHFSRELTQLISGYGIRGAGCLAEVAGAGGRVAGGAAKQVRGPGRDVEQRPFEHAVDEHLAVVFGGVTPGVEEAAHRLDLRVLDVDDLAEDDLEGAVVGLVALLVC